MKKLSEKKLSKVKGGHIMPIPKTKQGKEVGEMPDKKTGDFNSKP